MNKASVREIMLQHEKTFKEQVHDLHKLYGKQKLLMAERIKSRGQDAYCSMPPSSPESGKAGVGEINLGQRIEFWDQAIPYGYGTVLKGSAPMQTPGSLPKAISDWITTVEEIPRNSSRPARKRKIDLERPPEDDSDDELEISTNVQSQAASRPLGDLRGLQNVYPSFDAFPQQSACSSSQALPPTNLFQSNCVSSGESKMGSVSQEYSCIRFSQSLPTSLINTGQLFAGLGEKYLSFHNSGTVNSGASPSKNNTTLLPQADPVGRGSQETGRQARWIFQSPETNIVDTSVVFAAQQQQSSSFHLVPREKSSGTSHPPSHSSQRHTKSISLCNGSMSSTTNKVSLESFSQGVAFGAQKDTLNASAERLGDASNWFLKESSSQGASLANSVSLSQHELGISAEGRLNMLPGLTVPAGNEGLSQEQDLSLWLSKNPVLQLPQYQKQPFPLQHIGPTASQSLWMQSSPATRNDMHGQQQVVYGLHACDTLHTGYQGELLQRNPGNVAGSWNMTGLGHFSGIHLPPQKPPFKKPPRLVLKKDGVGTELKTSPCENDASEKEKSMQKTPLSVVETKSLQALSKSFEVDKGVQKESGPDEKLNEKVTAEKEGTPEEWTPGSTKELKEYSAISRLPIESTLSAVAHLSSALAFSQGVPASVLAPCIVQLNPGAHMYRSGNEISSGPIVFALQNESILQGCGSQLKKMDLKLEPEELVEQRFMNLKTSGIAHEKEQIGQITHPDTKDIQAPAEEVGFCGGEIDIGKGVDSVEERKESSKKHLSPEAVVIDGVPGCQSVHFEATQQDVQFKCEKEDVPNEKLRHSAQTLKEDEGSLLEQCANGLAHSESPSGSSSSFSADSIHLLEKQVIAPVQSTTINTPNSSRQVTRRSCTDNDALRCVSEKLSSTSKNQPRSPLSDRDCLPAASPATLMMGKNSEFVTGITNEDPQHDSDSDNLAASILLSFAPKLDLSNEDKRPKDTASEISSNNDKAKPKDQGRKSSRTSQGQIGPHSDYRSSSATSRGRRIQNVASNCRVNWTDHQDCSNLTIDRRKNDVTSSTKQQAGEGDVTAKNFTIKLPRVTGNTLNDDSIPISRSKQISKLNGVSSSQSPMESMKNLCRNIEVAHKPTGRRSSRGLLHGAGDSLESRSQPRHQSQHCGELSSPPLNKDPATRDGGVCSINKLVENTKSKPCGELNRKRSNPRKQCFEVMHRKSQK